MASFMKNWWDKHDMDRDGKGCCLIMTGILALAFLGGMTIAGLAIWAIFF